MVIHIQSETSHGELVHDHSAEEIPKHLEVLLKTYMQQHEASMRGNPLNPDEVRDVIETVEYMLAHDGAVNYAILKPFSGDKALMQSVIDCIGFERLTNVPH